MIAPAPPEGEDLLCPRGFDCQAMTGISTASGEVCMNADACEVKPHRYTEPMPELEDSAFDLDQYLQDIWAAVLDNR